MIKWTALSLATCKKVIDSRDKKRTQSKEIIDSAYA